MLFYEYSSKNTGWLKWIDAVESFLGHDMDGHQETDGYSLDLAHLAYSTGATVLEYATHVEGRKKAAAKKKKLEECAAWENDRMSRVAM